MDEPLALCAQHCNLHPQELFSLLIHMYCMPLWYNNIYASEFRPIYAGNALCTVRYTGEDPCMMSIRSTSFSPTEAMSEAKVAPITQVDLSFLSEGLFGFFTIFFY